ncbi:hypothetical protein DL98DRAFT_657775 [Cadophora sp. DSE1049]|nr:hypothetical protein DL98DRAFT_657775 [Cadophora sp. DSE1049]
MLHMTVLVLDLLVILLQIYYVIMTAIEYMIPVARCYRSTKARTKCENCSTPEGSLRFGFHFRKDILVIFPLSIAPDLGLYDRLPPISSSFVMEITDKAVREGPFCCLTKHSQSEILVDLVRLTFQKPSISTAVVAHQHIGGNAGKEPKSATKSRSFFRKDQQAELNNFLDNIILDKELSTWVVYGKVARQLVF